MKFIHGRVAQGQVVLDESLPEGTEVTVVIAAAEESFAVDEAQIAELHACIDEANRGDLVPLNEVLTGR